MSDPDAIVQLDADPARLAAAVHAVATDDEARAARLRAGAQQSAAEHPDDLAIARRFQTVLELGYLVASADGFDDRERSSLARLLESITGLALDHELLELHFRDLDEGVAALGRRERLARVAAELEHEDERIEAIELATLIALADGTLTAPELEVLVEAGGHMDLSPARIRTIVDGVGARVGARLR
jgi:tellurite resistance protein